MDEIITDVQSTGERHEYSLTIWGQTTQAVTEQTCEDKA
jgi:hypothetical protein